MLIDRSRSEPVASVLALDPVLLRSARADSRGVPLIGRSAEMRELRRAGGRDPALGRIYEGHVNGVQLVARHGTDAQRAESERLLATGNVFAVWNTQDPGAGLSIVADGDGFRLHGGKSWASGAGAVTRPIATAAWPDGRSQMCLIPMDRVAAAIDPSRWRPLGMSGSDSFDVSFDGVRLERDDLVGGPGDYERQPWFFGGALRFAAVQTGIVERLFDETVGYLRRNERTGDPYQRERIGEMRIAVQTALHFIASGTRAWEAYDRDPSAAHAATAIDEADMARAAVERAALETIERAVRSVGARGLVEPLPFAGLVRDLQMYLRQPAPDAALVRVAMTAIDAATD